MRPRYMTATRVARCSTTARLWLMKTYVSPRFCFRSISRLRICDCTETSSADLVERGDRLGTALLGRSDALHLERQRHDGGDASAWIEGRVGVLEDRLHPPGNLAAGDRPNVLPAEANASCRWRQQAEDHAGE